ncbi:hypothetical protein KY285_026834 [Solanum tuberosum]|nr:hypothetical protein KY285_026834 [Solanum tuberosum]
MASAGNVEHHVIAEEPMDGQVKIHGTTLAIPGRLKPLNSDNLGSPSTKFHQIADRRDEFS